MIKKIAGSLAILVLTVWAGAADADFISGSIGFANGFATIPSLVSTDTFFDINESDTIVIEASNDFATYIMPVVGVDDAGDIDTNGAGGLLYEVGGFTFTWDTIWVDTSVGLTCNAQNLCIDSRTLEVSGTVAGNDFDTTLFFGSWIANGACLEDVNNLGNCVANTYSPSWSSSLVMLPPLCCDVPVPGTLLLVGGGLLLLRQSRVGAQRSVPR